jgi:hemoglobin
MKSTSLAISVLFLLATGLVGCTGEKQPEDREFHTSGNREADQRAEQRMARDEQIKGKPADTDKKQANPLEAKSDKAKTLYERLGGDAGIRKLVDDFCTRALADPRVNWKRVGVTRGGVNFKRNESLEWKPTDDQINGMKYHMGQFLALATGGPSKYEGREMTQVHKGLHITNAEFDAAIGDFKASLDKLGVGTQEQKELLAILESTRAQIAEER